MSESSTCEHFLYTGSCKFLRQGSCRFAHDRTMAVMAVTAHPHPIGPDPSPKRKKNFCDHCNVKTKREVLTLLILLLLCSHCLCSSRPHSLNYLCVAHIALAVLRGIDAPRGVISTCALSVSPRISWYRCWTTCKPKLQLQSLPLQGNHQSALQGNRQSPQRSN